MSELIQFRGIPCIENFWLNPEDVIPWFSSGAPVFYVGTSLYKKLKEYLAKTEAALSSHEDLHEDCCCCSFPAKPDKLKDMTAMYYRLLVPEQRRLADAQEGTT